MNHDLKVEWMKTSSLQPYPNNTKKHPENQVIRIAQQIKEVGWTQPIVIDKNKVIIAGHGRLLAAQFLQLKDVPTVTLSNLSEDQIKAYRIADNASAESEWDLDFLRFEIGSLERVGFDMSLLAFGPDRLDELLKSDDDTPRTSSGEPGDHDAVDPEDQERDEKKTEIPADIEFAKEIGERNDFLVLLFDDKEAFKKACEKLGVKRVKYQLSSNSENQEFLSTGIGRVLDGNAAIARIQNSGSST